MNRCDTGAKGTATSSLLESSVLNYFGRIIDSVVKDEESLEVVSDNCSSSGQCDEDG